MLFLTSARPLLSILAEHNDYCWDDPLLMIRNGNDEIGFGKLLQCIMIMATMLSALMMLILTIIILITMKILTKLTLNIVAFPPWRKVCSQRVISANLFLLVFIFSFFGSFLFFALSLLWIFLGSSSHGRNYILALYKQQFC